MKGFEKHKVSHHFSGCNHQRDLILWERKIMKKSSFVGRFGKSVQNRINEKIPKPVHTVVTETIKRLVQGVLLGSEWLTFREPLKGVSWSEREEQIKSRLKWYKRVAAAEGAYTGYGGFLLGLADFPALLSIKIKFLFDAASIYGYDVRDYRERIYILHIFQLAYSSDTIRWRVFEEMKNWNRTVLQFRSKEVFFEKLDWQTFQREYRDYIDLPKLLQLIPGFGAVVGGVVNYRFLDELGETAMNSYRMRHCLEEKERLSY